MSQLIFFVCFGFFGGGGVQSLFSILFEIRVWNVSTIKQSIVVKDRFGVHRIQFWKQHYAFLFLDTCSCYWQFIIQITYWWKCYLCCFTIWCFIEKWELKLFQKCFVTIKFEIYIFIILLYIYVIMKYAWNNEQWCWLVSRW